MTARTIDIRPGVSVLAVLRHLNYKPWYALGEFVDNSVESYTKNRSELERNSGGQFKLRVDIDIDATHPARITIRDNAAGISDSEYSRAFRPAAIPPDRTGLAEFGMGMKSAACWFAPRWSVVTSALGESVARTVHFDIANIVDDNVEELVIRETSERPENHYTEIILEEPFHLPVGRTIGKFKEHLTDIYRAFIRSGTLELRLNGDVLAYSEPRILRAPDFRTNEGPIVEWRKEIAFDFGEGLSVHGFAALRERADTARAGFSLFRRGRVIQGSGDDGYRPPTVFGSANSYRYQRLFGELHLDGFEVSHTKDGFRWDENEQPFLDLLREHLDTDDMPILRQAEGYRVRSSRSQLSVVARNAVTNTALSMEARLPGVLEAVAAEELAETPATEMPHISTLASRRFNILFRDRAWSINIELTDDPSENKWLVFSDTAATNSESRRLDIRVSLAHPFMVRYAQTDAEDVEALLRVAASIALAEVLARGAGVRMAGTVLRNVNDILRDALSAP